MPGWPWRWWAVQSGTPLRALRVQLKRIVSAHRGGERSEILTSLHLHSICRKYEKCKNNEFLHGVQDFKAGKLGPLGILIISPIWLPEFQWRTKNKRIIPRISIYNHAFEQKKQSASSPFSYKTNCLKKMVLRQFLRVALTSLMTLGHFPVSPDQQNYPHPQHIEATKR